MPTTLVWDIDPIIVRIGPFILRWYSLCFAMAFVIALPIWNSMFTKAGKDPADADRFCRYLVIGVLLGARLGHVFFYDWSYYKHHLVDIFLPVTFSPRFTVTGFAGLASHGALLGIVLATFFFVKRVVITRSPLKIHLINRRAAQEFTWILDRLSILVALGCALIRIGNLMNSEIIGKPTHANYGIVFVKELREELYAHHTAIIKKIDFCKSKANDGLPRQSQYQPLQLTILFKETDKESIINFLQGPLKNHLIRLSHLDQPMVYECYGEPLSYTLTQQHKGYLATVHTLGIPRHPTQLYESLSYLLVFIASLGWWYTRENNMRPGRMFGVLMVTVSLLRFVYEFYKENQASFEADMWLNMGQVLSLPWTIIGLWFIFWPVKKTYTPSE